MINVSVDTKISRFQIKHQNLKISNEKYNFSYCHHQKELQDESDFQIISPGFRLIPLPFADDLRCVELEGYQLTTPGTDLNCKA